MKRSSSKTAVKWRKESRPYLMLIPAALVLLLISVYPVLYGIYMSMTNKNLLRPGRNDFIFLDNFIKLAQDLEAWVLPLYIPFLLWLFPMLLALLWPCC